MSDDGGVLDEFLYVLPDRQKRRGAEIARKIADVLALFERESSATCDVRDLGTIARALGLNPSEKQIERMIEAVEEPQPTGWVRFSRLEVLFQGILQTNEFQGELLLRDSEDKILAAFAALDPENNGYLESTVFQEMLMNQGEKFQKDEALECLNAAADPETGRINYADYAATLAFE